MKRIFLLLILAITSCHFQTSKETIPETEKIASLGKIYGFLKYYHPEVGKGKYNWDKEFLKYLPKILSATDKKSLSNIYLNWINNLGEIQKCENCNSEKDFFSKNFDLSWTQDNTIFTSELSSKLQYIENNRNQGENFYVSTEAVGKIKVSNEPSYKDFEYPPEEYRLLGLIKYWNIIEYFYPYKYLTDQDWDSVLKEMIPKFRNTKNASEYQATIRELIAKLDDTHARIIFSNKRPNFLPVKISNIENKTVVSGFFNDSIAKLNNLKLGDVILKIDDKNLNEEINENLKYVSGSNLKSKIRSLYSRIFSGFENSVKLTVERNGKIEKLKVNRYDFDEFNYRNNQKTSKSKSISENIGYINMANVRFEDVSDIFKSFENKQSIIIDLRNYPDFIYKYFTRYLNSKKRDFSKVYSPSLAYPGKFILKENLKTDSSKEAFNGKIILLVNGGSISRSEFTAMAFQTADDVITVGNQTAGADGDVVAFEYLGGYTTTISGNGILYPDGTETQRIGIKIDVNIKPTIEGIRQGRDEVLEKAIEIAE